LGFWQLARLNERKELNTRIETRMNKPAFELSEVADLKVDDTEYSKISLEGKFIESSDILIAGRSKEGEPGYNVMTAFSAGEKIVFVNRGWVNLPLGEAMSSGVAGEEVTSPAAGFEQETKVIGLIRKNEEKRLIGKSSEVDENNFVSTRIDTSLFSNRNEQVSNGQLVDFWVQETDQFVEGKEVERKDFPVVLPDPELTERNHFSYAMQWLIFGVVAIITWIVICVNAFKKEKRRENSSASK
jgi:cytochrome oxidase assembly protein ShyY1